MNVLKANHDLGSIFAALTSLAAAVALVFGVSVVSSDKGFAADGDVSDLVNRRVLRVCADPANLPFSGKDKPGFENKIADIVADELNIGVQYTWFPQATGFIRRTLFAKRCDIVMGYAQGDEFVLNTNHYYTSTYALVIRKGRGLDDVKSLDDPRLKQKRIGVVAGTPPASVLAKLRLIANAKPYQLSIDRRYFSPAEEMIKDIRSGEIDVGVLWGPNAGYFSSRNGEKLIVVPLVDKHTTESGRMSFRITMGVRQSDKDWKKQLNKIIEKRQAEINKVLVDFGVPLIKDEVNKVQFKTTN